MADKRNLVICCDGTGNVFGEENSNVVKLYAALEINEQQLGYYHPGVGTMGAPSAGNKLEEEWSIIKGLAFGAGLMANVGDAYRYLMQTYREGDDVYLFGFSRGAYTARALAGVLHMFGLLCPGNEGLIPYVTKMFARTSREVAAHRDPFKVARGFKRTFSRSIKVHFVGVWDTVSSVGWIYDTVKLPYSASNPIVRIGRHAVSIDERRCFFRDNLWGEPLKPGARDYDFDQPQDLKQVWFAGVHSDVGGGYAEGESGLSKLALEWMLREAELAGLRVRHDEARIVLGQVPYIGKEKLPYVLPDPKACMHQSLQGPWWVVEFLPHQYWDKDTKEVKWRIPMGAARNIPLNDDRIVIHQSVQQRMDEVPGYRPVNLPPGRLEEHFKIEPRVEYPAPQATVANP